MWPFTNIKLIGVNLMIKADSRDKELMQNSARKVILLPAKVKQTFINDGLVLA